MSAKGEVTLVEPSREEQAHARRVAMARATVPELVLRAPWEPRGMPDLIAACARALREQPRLNGAWRDGGIELYGRVNIAVVLAGAAAPTIFDADEKDPRALAQELDQLAERADAGELAPAELAGATFTVQELDVPSFAAVLRPPQSAVLAAGSQELTLSCDHRIIQGPEAASFLRTLSAG